MTITSDFDSSSPVSSAPVPSVPVTVDSKGRVRVSKAQREVILAEFERGGVSAAQFAQQTGLKYSTLAGWLQRYRRAKPRRPVRSLRLLEAVVESARGAVTGASLVLQLPGGVRSEVADEKQAALAAMVVRALAGPC
jgi:transposase-like protein